MAVLQWLPARLLLTADYPRPPAHDGTLRPGFVASPSVPIRVAARARAASAALLGPCPADARSCGFKFKFWVGARLGSLGLAGMLRSRPLACCVGRPRPAFRLD